MQVNCIICTILICAKKFCFLASIALEDSVDTYKYLNQNDESYYNGRKDSYITTDIVARMEADLERTRLVRGSRSHLAKRGDFTIHPQWPPSIVHHRLNGLSSVEIPYMHGRR